MGKLSFLAGATGTESNGMVSISERGREQEVSGLDWGGSLWREKPPVAVKGYFLLGGWAGG